MTSDALTRPGTGHAVTNQPPPLAGYDVYSADAALREAVHRGGAAWAGDWLSELGLQAGDPRWIEAGALANTNPPVLHTHDRYGHRIDEVRYHPAWHDLMSVATGHGLHGGPWAQDRPGGHVARAAGLLVWGQVDAGVCCPVTMTYSSVAALRAEPALAAHWEPMITTRSYDPRTLPAEQKSGVLIGMAMTEKQGGSDLRAGLTTAVPEPGSGPGAYRLHGHKWFCSAPMSDGFLVLAQAPDGLTCFLLPRVLPDGSLNAVRLIRLKDKLGNRSNASSEIELDGALAFRLGDEGRGVPSIAAMVNLTRLDCALGSAGLIRQAVAQALHHARYRQAFGRPLAQQPLMTAVLADLAIESEASTALALRLAAAVDATQRPDPDPGELMLRRIGTAVGKYWICKRGPAVTAEALECLGGNGYVEESVMPRLYREAPVNSVWEGSGNVNALDVLRALTREPGTAAALLAELELAAGADDRLDQQIARVRTRLVALPAQLAAAGTEAQLAARTLVEQLALTLQGALLARHAPHPVSDAFCSSRFGGGGWAFGTLAGPVSPAGLSAIVERHTPAL